MNSKQFTRCSCRANPVFVAPALAASGLAWFPSESDKFLWAAFIRHLATLSVLVHVGIVSTPPLRLGIPVDDALEVWSSVAKAKQYKYAQR